MNFLFRSQTPTIPCYAEQRNQIKSHHFCLKVLTAMYELQSGNSAYINGIKSKDIMRYMQEKFELDGDVKTQVHISLQQSLAYGFITKEFGRYKLVGPMAKVIQEPHDSQDRFNEIERVVKIFWSTRKFPSVAKYGNKSQLNLSDDFSCSSEGNQTEERRNSRKKRHNTSRSRSGLTRVSATSIQSGTTEVTGNTSVVSTTYEPEGKKQDRRRTSHKRVRKTRPRKNRRKKHALEMSSDDGECDKL